MSSEHQHEHSPHLGHHYETMEQQFASGKLGMWLFLATEILLFAGLFCAYAIYRANHPEVFEYAHQFLDKKMGGINTVILIASSFTMAMAVRSAQLGQRQVTAVLLAITLLAGFGFLGIKKVEYEHKWKHGLLWGQRYQNQEAHGHAAAGEHAASDAPAATDAQAAADEHAATNEHATLQADENVPETIPANAGDGRVAAPPTQDPTTSMEDAPPAIAAGAATDGAPASPAHPDEAGASAHDGGAADTHVAAAQPTTPAIVPAAATTSTGAVIERSALPPAAAQPQGLAPPGESDAAHHKAPKNVHIFFGIYFLMTGLHGIHVVAGMIAIGWILVRTLKGHFSPEYNTPVDLTGLYWHLVDLIWIFLFPLLYLIR